MKDKKINKLTGMQLLLVSILLISGLFFLGKSQPYLKSLDGETEEMQLSFLQKGEYTLEITYENSVEGNFLKVYSDTMTDGNNHPGVLYAKQDVAAGSGVVRVPVELEQGVYDLKIGAETEEAPFYIAKVTIQSNRLIYKDNYFVGALLIMAAGVLAWCFMCLTPEQYGVSLMLVVMGLVAGIPVMSQSLVCGDDLDFHLSRLEGIYQALAAGDFPVRITPQQMEGYGALTATMYPQLFLYPIAFLRFVGVSLMVGYKFLLVLINVGTAFAGYYSVKNICKSHKVAFWASLLYVFSAYRLCNVYQRAALGEALAMIFFPLIIWGVYEVLWGRKRWIVLALGMTGLLSSHLISVQMCVVFMVMELIYWLFSRKRQDTAGRIFAGLKAVGMTILLNAGFLVPFLYYSREKLQCFIMPFEVDKSVAYFSQMFALFPSGASGSMEPGSTQGEMSLTMGGVLLIGVLIFVYAYRKEKSHSVSAAVGMHCLTYGVVSTLLVSWIFPWEKIATVDFLQAVCGTLQFSWRFLGPASVFFCIVTALGIEKLREDGEFATAACTLIAGMMLITAGYMFDQLAQEGDQYTDKMELEGFEAVDSMYMYQITDVFQALHLNYNRENAQVIACNGSGMTFENYSKRGSNIYVETIPAGGAAEQLMLPLYWYPGYEVRVNGQEVPCWSLVGWLCCQVPGEKSVVEVSYQGFWYFTAADIISVLSFLSVAGYAVLKKRASIRQKAKGFGATAGERE